MFRNLGAIVTGGASGLGRATVERLAKAEARVVLCDLPSSNGQEVAKNTGPNVTFVPTDVTKLDDIKKMISKVHKSEMRVSVLVNCAGVSLSSKLYDLNSKSPHSLEDFQRVLDVNTLGTFNVIRHVTAFMHLSKPGEDGSRGVIINTAGISAFDGRMGDVACAASHGALTSMTLPLARDLASEGIRVVCIAPGFFDTPMTQSLHEKVKGYWKSKVLFPNRLGHPEEYASLVEHIIQNQMLNGEVIRLDGGVRMF